MIRKWVYRRMADFPPVVLLTPGGIHASSSTDIAPHQKPFIMFRRTSDVENFRGDDGDVTRTSGFMIFVHDLEGDYLEIDRILGLLEDRFAGVKDPASKVIRCRWLETSEDLRDEDMGTITKFARLQVEYKKEKR